MSALKSNLLLLLAAAIWGLAFVAQRVGMEHVGPFTFNGVRFALGSLSLLPLLFYYQGKPRQAPVQSSGSVVLAGVLAGLILFSAASLQQIALLYTTAGKAAFITCLYIVLVPVLGIFLKHHVGNAIWFSCILAVVGLYLLCVKESLTIGYGDFLLLAGALIWAVHILLIDYYASRVEVLKLSCYQFITCSVLSLAAALWLETITLAGLSRALMPILYGGIFSVGVAYTLQVVGQKYSPPSHAAIILSMETVFATLGGFFLLDERLGLRELAGCGLMLAGMLLTQLQSIQAGPLAENVEGSGGEAG